MLQNLEQRQNPGPEAHLARLAGQRIDLRQQRRREVEVGLVVALEHAFDLLLELAVGVQARDLVLVLVGEKLVVIARHRFGEL